jgi:hypothetical protein
MKYITTLLILFVASASFAASDGFSSLEEQMTGKEFMAAGLGKLTPEELAALNEWIRRHSVATLDAPTSAAATASAGVAATEPVDRRGLPSDDGDDEEPIVARLEGEFTGWDGQTVFKLDNGMIWVQADRDKHYVKAMSNPQVTISPGMFSAWYLSVDGSNSRCKVRRIQ